jgi:hypothetical protein
LRGPTSIIGDTLVGAFLIGFFTWLVMVPAARLEARAGRIRGLGRNARAFAWPRRHPLVSAIAFGLASVLLLAAPTLFALAKGGVAAMSQGGFVLFKSAFSGVAGVLTALVAALVAIAPEPDVSDDPRWCRDLSAASGPSWPCDYIDKGGLAVTSRSRGCSGTPTWQLSVTGALAPDEVRRALADLVTRYPQLTTKIRSLEGVPELATRFRYLCDPSFTIDQIFEAIDLRSGDLTLDALTRELQNRHLDLFTDFPLTLTLAITAEDACQLFFRQHHAIADGRAFIGLLVDFAAFLDDARAGRRPSPERLAPIARLGELSALALPAWRRRLDTLAGAGWLAGAIARALFRPLTPLAQNRSNDYRGENGVVHLSLADDVLARWDTIRRALGVSLASLLTGALFEANRRWHRDEALPVGRTTGTLVMETRPRQGGFLSFANHLATLDVEAQLDRATDFASLVRSIQAQLERQKRARTPIKRLLCERLIVLRMNLEALQRIVFESKRPAYNLNFSNLIPLAFPSLEGERWSVDEVRITTPVTPRTGIALTVIRYRGRVTFNFNYKASAATRAQTAALCGHFHAVLKELEARDLPAAASG